MNSLVESDKRNSVSKHWQVEPKIPPAFNEALKDYPALIPQLLYNRGITTAEEAFKFLNPQASDGYDPCILKDMDLAIERIHTAIQNQELIAIYGDYDVDGVTATTLMVEFLRQMGARVQEYIPNRFDEGYGVNNDALESLAGKGVGLVVTVDCGVRSPREAEYARKLNLDLIICDHHHPGPELPKGVAIINPKQPGDSYPEKELAGVGLAFKMVQAYLQSHPAGGIQAVDWLDLVALGTVSDLVPLTGENRALVSAGIRQIKKQPRQGLYSLAQVAGLNISRMNAGDIGYILGPRLNAAGRLDSALAAFKLLMVKDPTEASGLAQNLDVQNADRQRITREIQARADELASDKLAGDWIIFAMDPSFNEGVVGLAASRLVEAHYRPAIVGHLGDQVTRASCRSIPEFHITEALDQCADLLVRHGGHRAAAGFTVRNENLSSLLERMTAIARQQLSSLDLRPVIRADLELSLSQFGGRQLPELLNYLEKFEPTGMGNPEITFVSRNLEVRSARTVGRDGSHLKLKVSDRNIVYDAIAFRQGQWITQLPERIDLLYTLELNEYNGQQTLQLNVKDIKAVGLGDD